MRENLPGGASDHVEDRGDLSFLPADMGAEHPPVFGAGTASPPVGDVRGQHVSRFGAFDMSCVWEAVCGTWSVGKVRRMNQRDRVLNMLKAGPVCGTDLLRAYIPRYSARIYELRQQGHVISSEPCKLHDHRDTQTVYRLATTDQMSLPI